MLSKTKLYSGIAIMGLIALGGCSKSGDGTSKKKPSNTTNINPVTATAVCDFDVNDTTLTNHGWTKAFDDEFNDLSNWNVLTGGQQGVIQCNEPANAQIVNGVLQIATKREAVTGPTTVGSSNTSSFDFTSAWLTSKQTFSANTTAPKVRIVARIKIAKGTGITSLLWTYGAGVWPTGGEIDCVEAQGNTTTMYSTDYKFGTSANVSLATGSHYFNPTSEDLANCYHVYTMEWTQNSLNSYLDGKLVEVKTAGGYIGNLFGTLQTLSLTAPIGGWFYDSSLTSANIQAGGIMYVDYVKVFTSK